VNGSRSKPLVGILKLTLAVLEPDSIPEDVESLQISNSTLELGQNLTVVGNNPAVSRPIFVSGTVIDLSENITTKENVTLDDSVVISAAIELGFQEVRQ